MMKSINLFMKLAVILCIAALSFSVAGCGGDEESDSASSGGAESTAKTAAPAEKTYDPKQSIGDKANVYVDSDKAFNADQQAVITQLAGLSDATFARDYKAICEDFYDAKLTAAAPGGDCVKAMEDSNPSMKSFEMKIKSVKIDAGGKSATVDASASVDGGRPARSDLKFVKDDEGTWRLAST